jgi:hypothetical protein
MIRMLGALRWGPVDKLDGVPAVGIWWALRAWPLTRLAR